MNIFQPDGHLTHRALAALIRQELPEELQRLEVAEHLAYCDCCLQRYTDLLEGTELLTPEHSCREPLLRRIRRRAISLFTSRYAAAAAAVAAALILVWAGPDKVALFSEHPRPERPALQETDQLSRRWNEALNHFSHQLREHLTLPDDFLKED